MGKKIIIPESVCSLSDQDRPHCQLLKLKCKWPVDIELMQINVPQGDLEIAERCYIVGILTNRYKFSLQSTLV